MLERAERLGSKERINIILEEYKTLRAEMIQHFTCLMQALALAASALVATFGFMISQNAFVSGVAIFAVVLICFVIGFFIFDYDCRLMSQRLREIEKFVNDEAGDELLLWETTRGIENHGYLKRFREIYARITRRENDLRPQNWIVFG